MLLFRSEEHVDRWRQLWKQPRGESFSTETGWTLAHAWFDGRITKMQRRTPEEAHALFAKLGLTSDFWKLS